VQLYKTSKFRKPCLKSGTSSKTAGIQLWGPFFDRVRLNMPTKSTSVTARTSYAVPKSTPS